MPAARTCPCTGLPPLETGRKTSTEGATTRHPKMQRCASVVFVSLIVCASVSHTFGLVLSAKEKRGWTLNSAGYLLGPHAVDNHRSFNDKHGLAGKREVQPEDDLKSGNLVRTLTEDNVVRTVIEFLTYLHLKEAGAFDNLPSPTSSEETNQA
ncbi:galanin peptides isoform X1 [Ambystoma mexicanum]|uniref:galanin peptides isoform X1 n=1 Tax=Ambystoma mexicanum TaxID=8296 RepID=UPI0037E7B24D